jgi:uncharacterized protein (DUF1501 family)
MTLNQPARPARLSRRAFLCWGAASLAGLTAWSLHPARPAAAIDAATAYGRVVVNRIDGFK